MPGRLLEGLYFFDVVDRLLLDFVPKAAPDRGVLVDGLTELKFSAFSRQPHEKPGLVCLTCSRCTLKKTIKSSNVRSTELQILHPNKKVGSQRTRPICFCSLAGRASWGSVRAADFEPSFLNRGASEFLSPEDVGEEWMGEHLLEP